MKTTLGRAEHPLTAPVHAAAIDRLEAVTGLTTGHHQARVLGGLQTLRDMKAPERRAFMTAVGLHSVEVLPERLSRLVLERGEMLALSPGWSSEARADSALLEATGVLGPKAVIAGLEWLRTAAPPEPPRGEYGRSMGTSPARFQRSVAVWLWLQR
ncbi:MAG: hypothetical protein U1E65_33440 [Myxococcota bacterium]